MLHRGIQYLIITFLFIGASGCVPKQVAREPIVVIADEMAYTPAGQPYVPTKDGFWLSKEVLTRLLERLEDLQAQIDSIPKVDGNNPQGPQLIGMYPASRGHSTDDSARLLGSMANIPDGDNYDPQARYQAEMVGMPKTDRSMGTVTRAAGRLRVSE